MPQCHQGLPVTDDASHRRVNYSQHKKCEMKHAFQNCGQLFRCSDTEEMAHPERRIIPAFAIIAWVQIYIASINSKMSAPG